MSTTRIRWWPAIAICVLTVAALAWVWLRPAQMTQTRVVGTFPVLGLAVIALTLWLILASRLSFKVRAAFALGLVTLVVLGATLFEITGVDGNIVPVLGFRWAQDHGFEQPDPDLAEAPTSAPLVDLELEPAGSILPTGPHGRDFPQFYGPGRDSTLDGPRLETDWQQNPPELLWRTRVGEAWSAFSIVDDAAITLEQRGQNETLVRYELTTGKVVWTSAHQADFDTTIGGRGPRSTPTIFAGRVYSLGATGQLSSNRLDTGSLVWSRNVLEDHQAQNSEWGMSSSPLLVGDLVVVQLGIGGQSLAAYHRHDGSPAWQAGTDQGSYSSPILATVAGREQILITNNASVAGHDPVTGEQLWSTDWTIPGQRITPPLIVDDDLLLVSAGYGIGSRLLRLVEQQNDQLGVEEIWETRRLKSKFASMVIHQETVYGLDDGVLVALDPTTGERKWKRGRYGHGQLMLVGELLLILTEKGDLVLVPADPNQHTELSRITVLDGKSWNPPALAGDLLLVRNHQEAACYRLATES